MTIAMHSRASWREAEPRLTVGRMDDASDGTIARAGHRLLAATNAEISSASLRSVEKAERALEDAARAERGEREDVATVWQASTILIALALVCATAMIAVVSL